MLESIKNIINTKPKNSVTIHIKKIPGFQSFLENSKYNCIYELIYCIKNQIDDPPLCELSGCFERKLFRKNNGYSRGCSKKHSTMITSLETYGTDNPSKSTEIKNKIKESNLIKYGMHPSQRENERKKISERMIDLHTDGKILEKIRKTNLEKYGTEYTFESDEIKNKIKKTMVEKYNVEHNLESGSISREKRKQTMIERYGFEYTLQDKTRIEEIHKKLKHTRLKERLKIINKHYKPLFNIENYDGVYKEYDWECVSCETIFSFKIEDGKNPRCPKCFPKNRSLMETQFISHISSNMIKIKSNDRSLKDKNEKIIELDFILNDNLAVELNGNYWHSELNGKNKKYHLNKTNIAKENGIQLLHIFEDEWIEKREIVKSIINAKLGNFDVRLFARNCKIKEIKSKEKNQFLENNHLQGQDKSLVKLGLFYNDILVSVMTFGKSRYNKKYQYEMHRFCNKIGYQIVGGASKLWKYFVKTYDPESVITYADRRYSDGSFYEKIGFTLDDITPPNFFYLCPKNKLERKSRIQFQKHKLNERLDNFDSDLTEWENMQNNGYDRIWDCGNYKFIWLK